jgi:hypothetical protein
MIKQWEGGKEVYMKKKRQKDQLRRDSFVIINKQNAEPTVDG